MLINSMTLVNNFSQGMPLLPRTIPFFLNTFQGEHYQRYLQIFISDFTQ